MNLENSPKDADKSAMRTDADLAADLLDDVIGTRGIREPVKSMLERAYGQLRKRNDAWTRRRVRAVFNKEANRIDHREIEEMRSVIQAREQHAAYREETARIAQMALVRAPAHDRGLDQGQGGRPG